MAAIPPHPPADPPLSWPTPPYASYATVASQGRSLACEVEGVNGHVLRGLLMGLDAGSRAALVHVPGGRAPAPLRFDAIRRITLAPPLAPQPLQAGRPERRSAHDDLLAYRARIQYRLELADGTPREGETIGYVENDAGLFLFHPLDEQDRVQRLFYPREVCRGLHVGDRLGTVLVAQQSLSETQIAQAVQEQTALRERRLGDYLVKQEVVSPDQLLLALEQQSKMPLVRIGDSLLALGLVSQAQIDDALEQQKRDRRVPLGELLVRGGKLSRRDLQTALAHKMGFPVVNVDSFPLDVDAVRKVPHAVASRLNVLPLLARDGLLVVAAEDPSRRATIEELEFVAQSKVLTAIAGGGELSDAVAQAYARAGFDGPEASSSAVEEQRKESAQDSGAVSRLLETLEQESDGSHDDGALIEQSDNSLVLLINAMIVEAHRQGVSDIHIETSHVRRKVRIRFRKDGVLVPYMELPQSYRTALVARLKIMCDLDITERRQPQDGKIDFVRFSSQHHIELRVATIPTQGGAEDVVMRILSSARPLPLDRLGLSVANFEQLQQVVERPYGMVLCVGPTGSGKTTTLHSVLQHLNTPQRKIWTAENPIEITNPDLRQVQVNPKIGWSFDKVLRTFLRADPDVIMVGEVRDEETAQLAVEASLTGHLVLSTLHTNSAPETITRLLDMGLNPFSFADSLLAVLAQRLVRQLCEACKAPQPVSEAEEELLLQEYLGAFPADTRPQGDALRADWLKRFGVNGRLRRHRATGCAQCEHTGYKGRLGLHELLVVDDEIRHLIMTGATPLQLRHSAMRHGQFRTLRQDGIERALAGRTTLAEVRANCNI